MANKKLAQLKKHIKPFENPDTKQVYGSWSIHCHRSSYFGI